MVPRSFLLRRLCLLHHGGGRARTLSYSSFDPPHRPPSSVPPPRFHAFRTSPSPSSTALPGAGASATWPPSEGSSPPPRPYNPMASYLARACGFSYDEAAAAAELLSGNKSPTNPNPSSSSAHRGKSSLDTQIGWLVSSATPLPGDKNRATGDVDFSGRTLAQLLLLDPGVRTAADASHRAGFWCALFKAEADLLRALESNARSPGSSPKETAVRKMILLLECGVPNRKLREALRKGSEDVARSVDSLEALIRRVEEMGLARGRRAAYRYALEAVAALSRRKLEAKLGEHQVPGAVGNALGLFSNASVGNGGKAADCRFGEDGIEASDAAAAAPSIPLALGLEKKVMPPYYVLQMLRSVKGGVDENRASYLLRMCKKARFWTNSHAGMNREFQSFMKLMSLLVRGRIAV